MSSDELLDVLAADGTPTGTVKRRADVHRDGDWHAAFHLWVVTGREVLLQRRGQHKAAWPGRLDATAAGHLIAGEAAVDGLREAEEELGATYSAEALIELGTFTVDESQAIGTNREFQHVFAVRDARPLESFTGLDRDEVDGLVAVEHGVFGALVDGTGGPARCWDGSQLKTIEVEPRELVPAPYLSGIARRLAELAG